MILEFNDSDHSYIDRAGKKFQSVTTIIHNLCNPFNAEEQAPKSAKKKNNKWYGLSVEEILQAWKDENTRSTELGSWYHKTQEDYILKELVKTSDREIKYPIYIAGKKKSPSQRLENNCIYPEHMVYLESAGIAGQVDRVDTINWEIFIQDHKTSKSIDTTSYVGYEGSKKMLGPVSHLDDCNFNHYTLQLSFYAYMIKQYQPLMNIKELVINHVEFESEGENKYGYPIYRQNDKGDYIVKGVTPYHVPYLKREVIAIINHLKSQNK